MQKIKYSSFLSHMHKLENRKYEDKEYLCVESGHSYDLNVKHSPVVIDPFHTR